MPGKPSDLCGERRKGGIRLLACLTSHQHAGVSQGRISPDTFTCYYSCVVGKMRHLSNVTADRPVSLLCCGQGAHRMTGIRVSTTIHFCRQTGLKAVLSNTRDTQHSSQQRFFFFFCVRCDDRANCTVMLSLIRRQPIFYPRQVGCVIRFRRLRFLLRVASSPRIAALPSWRVHPTRVCVLCFHRIDGLSFRTCEHHLPDCYDLQQGVSLFRLHNCWELQVLLFHLLCRWGWAI